MAEILSIGQSLKIRLPSLREGVLLKDWTTFRIGGPAKYFFQAETEQDFIKAIKTARKLNVPFFVFGGGSNLLVSDDGYDGMIIKCEASLIKHKQQGNVHIIKAEAGAKLMDIVNFALQRSLVGLEWMAGIPGSIGGAIRGNAAAFGGTTGDIVTRVMAFNVRKYRKTLFQNIDCNFAVKNSIFKQDTSLIILDVEIELEKGDREQSKKEINKHLNLRKERHPLDLPSAGCIFINPMDNSAGLLIDKCGLKGVKIGGVQVSEKHANFIVNIGDAKAKDVIALIKLVKSRVKDKFGIELKEEIHYLGF